MSGGVVSDETKIALFSGWHVQRDWLVSVPQIKSRKYCLLRLVWFEHLCNFFQKEIYVWQLLFIFVNNFIFLFGIQCQLDCLVLSYGYNDWAIELPI